MSWSLERTHSILSIQTSSSHWSYSWSDEEINCTGAVHTLRKKFPNAKFFLVRIFLYSVQIWQNMGQKKLHIWTFFAQWYFCNNEWDNKWLNKSNKWNSFRTFNRKTEKFRKVLTLLKWWIQRKKIFLAFPCKHIRWCT